MHRVIKPAPPVTATKPIDLEELRKRLAERSVDEFWNVLTDKYFSGELIPGSRHVALDTIGRVSATMPKDATIIVYCANYDCPQSAMASRKLEALGFTDVYAYEGGLQEWEEEGYELVGEA